jgi:hypothetical protein
VGANGDEAILRGIFQQEAQTFPDKKTIVARGRFEGKWRRQADGRWLIERMTTMPIGAVQKP